jgi:membrane-bound hydrogenase subunit beta
MQTEQEIVSALIEMFGFLQDRIYVQRKKRIFTRFLTRDEFEQVLHYLHDGMDFHRAHHVVGTDEGDDLGFTYILSNKDDIMLALKEKAPKASPRISSMSPIYPSLLLHERELVDLFGAEIEGLPQGLSYPLPDGWPKGNYPMRKDWDPKYFNKNTMTYDPPSKDEGAKDVIK